MSVCFFFLLFALFFSSSFFLFSFLLLLLVFVCLVGFVLLLFLFKKWCACLQCYLVVAWLVPRETAAVSAHVLCIPYTHAPVYCVTSFDVDMDEDAARATGGASSGGGGGGVKFSTSVHQAN